MNHVFAFESLKFYSLFAMNLPLISTSPILFFRQEDFYKFLFNVNFSSTLKIYYWEVNIKFPNQIFGKNQHLSINRCYYRKLILFFALLQRNLAYFCSRGPDHVFESLRAENAYFDVKICFAFYVKTPAKCVKPHAASSLFLEGV